MQYPYWQVAAVGHIERRTIFAEIMGNKLLAKTCQALKLKFNIVRGGKLLFWFRNVSE